MFDDIRPIHGKAPGDQYSDDIDEISENNPMVEGGHRLDGEAAKKTHSQLLGWYYLEREKQAENRMEMSLDHAFYDNEQWLPEDAQELKNRGQMPLVYNEVAPMVDWVIGTERRTRVDWKILPRTEDDVQLADIKTKTMKFVSDINRVPFARSRAFADAVKGGIGWVDDGVRDDPTEDPIYSKYEDWRNVIWDSASYDLDLTDARYIFRWRWVDEDVALMMFPERADQIRQAVEDAGAFSMQNEEDTWYVGEKLDNKERSGTVYASGAGVMVDTQRRRIKLIEGQFRMPAMCRVAVDGSMKGAFLNDHDAVMQESIVSSGSEVVEKMMMRVHVAVFTEAHMLALSPSPFRHNRFSLTPVWCYRRGRDRQPYGIIRRVRDVQQDLNKRASKALFMLNTNQIFADEGAVDDWNNLRDEVDRPDGLIVKKPNKEIVVRRDTDAATGQIQMMTLAAQSIQKSAGVSQENLGRQTNAVSGEAIKARQLQGSVVTTEPFDNLRYTVQVQGEKQLSMVEQFYTEEKVIRLTGARGAIEWVRFNQPEMQPDGSVRIINDIASSQADFVVSEQDYAGTLRQVMFDSLQQMATRLPPEVSLRLMTIAMEFSDLPNKDEITDAIRKLTGDRDPNKEMNPEEAQQMQEQMQMQAEQMQMQREQAMLALEEARAKVRELNAKAAAMEAQAAGQGGEGMPPEIEQAIRQVQSQAADQIDRLSQQLGKAQADLANRTLQISRDSDVKLESARIDADAKVRVAEIQANADRQISALEKRMESIAQGFEAKLAEKDKAEPEEERLEIKQIEALIKPLQAQIDGIAKQEKVEPKESAPSVINISTGGAKKSIKINKDADGNIVGANVTESEE